MASCKADGFFLQRNTTIAWISLGFLILLEYCLFRQYVLREIAPYYPATFDQNGYLQASYILYNNILTFGLKKALLSINLSPQTFFFPIQAAIAYLFFGASRLTALSLNFVYFALLQLIVFQTLKQITNRYLLGYLAIGILLSTQSFFFIGGAYDFRIDFMALCLYGIFACSVLYSDIFMIRKWVLISAGIAAFLIAIRFITIAYILGVASMSCFYYSLLYVLKNNRASNTLRLKNIILFTAMVLVLIFPILWLHRDLICSYYVVGHYSGAEKIMRAKEVGVIDFCSNLFYYPYVFIKQHVGEKTIIDMVGVVLIFAAWSFSTRFYAISTKKHSSVNYADVLTYLLISIIVPMIVLTVDQSKSVIVFGIVLVPFCLLFIFLIASFYQKIISTSPKVNWLLLLVTLFFLINGLNHYFSNHSSRSSLYDQQMMVVTTMINDIGNYAVKAGWQDIVVSADQIADYLIYPIQPFYYETHGVLLNVRPGLGATEVNPETQSSALSQLNSSQVVIVNEKGYSPNKFYPFEASIAPYRFLLKKIVEKNFSLLGKYSINNIAYDVYVKAG